MLNTTKNRPTPVHHMTSRHSIQRQVVSKKVQSTRSILSEIDEPRMMLIKYKQKMCVE